MNSKYTICTLYIGEGNGTPLHYPCLENPMDRGDLWATVHMVAKSRTWMKWHSTHAHWICLIYYYSRDTAITHKVDLLHFTEAYIICTLHQPGPMMRMWYANHIQSISSCTAYVHPTLYLHWRNMSIYMSTPFLCCMWFPRVVTADIVLSSRVADSPFLLHQHIPPTNSPHNRPSVPLHPQQTDLPHTHSISLMCMLSLSVVSDSLQPRG